MENFIDNITLTRTYLKSLIEAGTVDLDAIIDTHILVMAGKPAVCVRYTDLRAEYTQAVSSHVLMRRYRHSYGYSERELDLGIDERDSIESEYLLAHATNIGRVLGIPKDATLAACYRD